MIREEHERQEVLFIMTAYSEKYYHFVIFSHKLFPLFNRCAYFCKHFIINTIT